jgi:hypothetical protein
MDELLDRANFYAYSLKRFDRAIELYHKYDRLRPDDRGLYIYLFHAYCFNKDYKNAWKTFEGRFSFYETKNASEMAQFELKNCLLPKRWDGKQDITGKKVLVWGEEGIGDILHFCRYLSLLKAQKGHVIFATRYPVLRTLLEKQPYIDDIFIDENDSKTPDYDTCLPLMSIPFLTGFDGFLPPPYVQVEGKTEIPGDKKKIGICWAGDATFFKDTTRSHALQEFHALATKDVQLVSLQKEMRLDAGKETMNLLELPIDTLEDTAKIINGVDAVISVDTCVAHLAGAMNKKVFLLKPNYPEWRWGLDETSTPWYPNTRLCCTPGEIISLILK